MLYFPDRWDGVDDFIVNPNVPARDPLYYLYRAVVKDRYPEGIHVRYWQDAAGTVPVRKVGDPIGRMDGVWRP